MPTQSVLKLVNAVAEDALQLGVASANGALRAQAAFVRSLVDEVKRHHPSDHWVAPLHQQLGEEIERLGRLAIEGSGSGVPDEGEVAAGVDVLVVDDEPVALHAMAAALREFGYPCRLALSGAEALRAYQERPASIVLSDWNMPGMDGLELCRALRSRTDRPYIILATAFHDDGQVLDAARDAADDFLSKPIDLEELDVRLSAARRLVRAVSALARMKTGELTKLGAASFPGGVIQT